MRTPVLLPVIVLMLLGFHSASEAQQYHVLRSGSDCGRLTLSYERLANGYMQCEMREERRFIGIDDKSVTWKRNLTILVDSTLRILSISGREFVPEGDCVIKGSCVDGVLYLSREEKSGRVESWRENCSAVPDVFLPELVLRADIPTPKQVFFVHDLASRNTTVRSTDQADGSLHIAVGTESEFVVAARGEILSWRMSAIDLAWETTDTPVSGIEPCDVDCGVFWDAGQVTLPTEADNIRSMDVRLSLTKDVGARLVPEDLRQHIAENNPGSGAAANLRITRTRQKPGDETLPILDEDLIEYEKESPLLPVTAESVRDRAAQLRLMDRNAGVVVGEIMNWMKSHFVEDPFVPVVAADRILETPRGTSLHAAMLFVTLARASGIPARLVLGMHPEGDRWRSSVWAEVWSGRWQSVDPGVGEFIDDATHVKLLHVADVQQLRDQAQRLRGAVRLDLLAVEEIDATAAGKLRTGIFNGAYSDRVFKCTVTAPRGWNIERRELTTQTSVIMAPEAGSDIRFEMQLTHNPYPLATREVFDAKVMALKVVLADVEILEKGEIRFGERRASTVLYSYRDTRPGSGKRRITTADCIFTIGERGYLFRFTAPSDVFHEYDGTLQTLLQNVVLYGD
ncbi:MAG: transglutaminase domain-containing protein [Bacteroidetes bacterium]|nr:transglutaminase domain-containing protein [Bacteroidota bacterium]